MLDHAHTETAKWLPAAEIAFAVEEQVLSLRLYERREPLSVQGRQKDPALERRVEGSVIFEPDQVGGPFPPLGAGHAPTSS
jgi:hypothetical protein